MKGLCELLLLGAVCAACWLRTPAGALAGNAVAWALDEPRRELLSCFSTRLPAEVDAALREALAVRGAEPAAALPAGWTPALRLAVRTQLGEGALAALQAAPLDDPAAALERWAVGEAQRDRAIRRAAAAGEPAPEQLSAHRRFLPAAGAAAAARAVDDVLALATVLDLAWPVERSARVSSAFGWRDHPVLHRRQHHDGVDLAVPGGTPVLAAGGGRVERARADAVSGLHVVLDHGHGVTTSYCHGSALLVQGQDDVARAQPILSSGSSGRSTGPHLHFGLRIGGKAVDPLALMP